MSQTRNCFEVTEDTAHADIGDLTDGGISEPLSWTEWHVLYASRVHYGDNETLMSEVHQAYIHYTKQWTKKRHEQVQKR